MKGGRVKAGVIDKWLITSLLLVPLPKAPAFAWHWVYDVLGVTEPASSQGSNGLETAMFSKV